MNGIKFVEFFEEWEILLPFLRDEYEKMVLCLTSKDLNLIWVSKFNTEPMTYSTILKNCKEDLKNSQECHGFWSLKITALICNKVINHLKLNISKSSIHKFHDVDEKTPFSISLNFILKFYDANDAWHSTTKNKRVGYAPKNRIDHLLKSSTSKH